jgi:hypothetical protein
MAFYSIYSNVLYSMLNCMCVSRCNFTLKCNNKWLTQLSICLYQIIVLRFLVRWSITPWGIQALYVFPSLCLVIAFTYLPITSQPQTILANVYTSLKLSVNNLIYFRLFFQGFELRALHLLGRCSISWGTPPVLL